MTQPDRPRPVASPQPETNPAFARAIAMPPPDAVLAAPAANGPAASTESVIGTPPSAAGINNTPNSVVPSRQKCTWPPP
jgi:hypothetical protein